MKLGTRAMVATLVVIWAVTPVLAAGPTYRVDVAGLACPFCAYGIEKRLLALDGVERLETSIKDGTVTIVMKEGAVLDESTARQAVEDAGFTLGGFERVSSGEDR